MHRREQTQTLKVEISIITWQYALKHIRKEVKIVKRGKQTAIAVFGVLIAFLTALDVMANPQISDTPLYTFRIEQASNEMNFLPTTVNTFTYLAEEEYTLEYGPPELRDSTNPLSTFEWTCIDSTCGNTCNTCYSCWLTCEASKRTCPSTSCPGC